MFRFIIPYNNILCASVTSRPSDRSWVLSPQLSGALA